MLKKACFLLEKKDWPKVSNFQELRSLIVIFSRAVRILSVVSSVVNKQKDKIISLISEKGEERNCLYLLKRDSMISEVEGKIKPSRMCCDSVVKYWVTSPVKVAWASETYSQ